MKTLHIALYLLLLVGVSFAQQAKDKTRPVIVAGEGWGSVRLGAKRTDVESGLGKGENLEKYSDVYFVDYTELGLQVSFNNTDDRIHAIFFYNKQRRSEEFGFFVVETSKGIGWSSSEEEVIKAYGKPKNDFSGDDGGGTWRRLVFDGIDFRFENKRLVRMGIPGN